MKVLKLEEPRYINLSDSTIVERILAGEKELYELLMRRNNQKLFRVIRGYISEESEIEDIMQNAYLKSYENLHRFHHGALFSTWLIRIGINEALARLRSKGKTAHLHDSITGSAKGSVFQLADSELMNPEKLLVRQEAKLLLEKAIDQLNHKYKSVYIMKEIEGMSIAEISDCLELTTSNVKVRLHRAKSMMKEELYELSKSYEVFEFGFSRCDRLVESVLSLI